MSDDVEVTEAMIEVGEKALLTATENVIGDDEVVTSIYRAMRLAAPQPEPAPLAGVVEALQQAPDISHARIVAPKDRVAEVVITATLRDELLAALSSLQPAQQAPAEQAEVEDPESDPVRRLSEALLANLRTSEAKYGWERAWMRDNWKNDLASQLRRHVDKGDPIDVAAYAAFAWHHGWPTKSPPIVKLGERAVVGELTVKNSSADADGPGAERPFLASETPFNMVQIEAIRRAGLIEACFPEETDTESGRQFWRWSTRTPASQPDAETVERVGMAISEAWNADTEALPPIELTRTERNYLACAAIAALSSRGMKEE